MQAKDRLANKTSAAKEPLWSVGGSAIYPRPGRMGGSKVGQANEEEVPGLGP